MKLPEFNFNSTQHLSLLLFGGTIQLDVVEPVLDADGAPVIYKGGQKAGQIKTKKGKQEYKVTGLGIKIKGLDANDKGHYSTNEKVLQKIASGEF
jgi:hypothetical protein